MSARSAGRRSEMWLLIVETVFGGFDGLDGSRGSRKSAKTGKARRQGPFQSLSKDKDLYTY